MKSFVIVFLIGVYLMVGQYVHSQIEEELINKSEENFKEEGYKDIKVVGFNLPYSFTYLFENVEGEVFFEMDGMVETLNVNVKHRSNNIPLLGVFTSDYEYVMEIPSLRLMNLFNLI